MGSQSDWATMRHAAETLEALGISHARRIVSAHRTPDRLYQFAKGARDAGFKVIIAGAGGAAHLPGMTAALTSLPVLGVPVESKALSGPGFAAIRSSRCRPASRSARWRSARPARSMRRCSPPRCWRSPTRRSPSGSTPGAPAQTAAVAERPSDARMSGAARAAARRSASSAAASSAACWRWPPPGSATAPSSSSRRPIARPRSSPTGRSSPPMTTRPRSTNWRGVAPSSPTSSRTCRSRPPTRLAGSVPVYPPPRALEVAQDRLAEKRFLNDAGISTARLFCCGQ